MPKVWMAVTNDDYELPYAVADTATELARICGVSANAIYCSLDLYKKGRREHPRFVCVKFDDNDLEDLSGAAVSY